MKCRQYLPSIPSPSLLSSRGGARKKAPQQFQTDKVDSQTFHISPKTPFDLSLNKSHAYAHRSTKRNVYTRTVLYTYGGVGSHTYSTLCMILQYHPHKSLSFFPLGSLTPFLPSLLCLCGTREEGSEMGVQ